MLLRLIVSIFLLSTFLISSEVKAQSSPQTSTFTKEVLSPQNGWNSTLWYPGKPNLFPDYSAGNLWDKIVSIKKSNSYFILQSSKITPLTLTKKVDASEIENVIILRNNISTSQWESNTIAYIGFQFPKATYYVAYNDELKNGLSKIFWHHPLYAKDSILFNKGLDKGYYMADEVQIVSSLSLKPTNQKPSSIFTERTVNSKHLQYKTSFTPNVVIEKRVVTTSSYNQIFRTVHIPYRILVGIKNNELKKTTIISSGKVKLKLTSPLVIPEDTWSFILMPNGLGISSKYIKFDYSPDGANNYTIIADWNEIKIWLHKKHLSVNNPNNQLDSLALQRVLETDAIDGIDYTLYTPGGELSSVYKVDSTKWEIGSTNYDSILYQAIHQKVEWDVNTPKAHWLSHVKSKAKIQRDYYTFNATNHFPVSNFANHIYQLIESNLLPVYNDFYLIDTCQRAQALIKVNHARFQLTGNKKSDSIVLANPEINQLQPLDKIEQYQLEVWNMTKDDKKILTPRVIRITLPAAWHPQEEEETWFYFSYDDWKNLSKQYPVIKQHMKLIEKTLLMQGAQQHLNFYYLE
ncbi:MAG: hypothetical protein U0U66_00075 [Cytophagaceae bacterium]